MFPITICMFFPVSTRLPALSSQIRAGARGGRRPGTGPGHGRTGQAARTAGGPPRQKGPRRPHSITRERRVQNSTRSTVQHSKRKRRPPTDSAPGSSRTPKLYSAEQVLQDGSKRSARTGTPVQNPDTERRREVSARQIPDAMQPQQQQQGQQQRQQQRDTQNQNKRKLNPRPRNVHSQRAVCLWANFRQFFASCSVNERLRAVCQYKIET